MSGDEPSWDPRECEAFVSKVAEYVRLRRPHFAVTLNPSRDLSEVAVAAADGRSIIISLADLSRDRMAFEDGLLAINVKIIGEQLLARFDQTYLRHST